MHGNLAPSAEATNPSNSEAYSDSVSSCLAASNSDTTPAGLSVRLTSSIAIDCPHGQPLAISLSPGLILFPVNDLLDILTILFKNPPYPFGVPNARIRPSREDILALISSNTSPSTHAG